MFTAWERFGTEAEELRQGYHNCWEVVFGQLEDYLRS